MVDIRHIEKWMCLRVLKLSSLEIISLSNSIGKLLHLRYLDMSCNGSLMKLPNGITKLYNLQTLLLNDCSSLSELPKDFCRLVKLRHLDLAGCYKLTCMPSGMHKLTSLKVLPYFVVEQSEHDELKSLKGLTGITGNLSIRIGVNYRRVEEMNVTSGGYLKSMKHLAEVHLSFRNYPDKCVNKNDEAALNSGAASKSQDVTHVVVWGYKYSKVGKSSG